MIDTLSDEPTWEARKYAEYIHADEDCANCYWYDHYLSVCELCGEKVDEENVCDEFRE